LRSKRARSLLVDIAQRDPVAAAGKGLANSSTNTSGSSNHYGQLAVVRHFFDLEGLEL
jgi:hypothetical protein